MTTSNQHSIPVGEAQNRIEQAQALAKDLALFLYQLVCGYFSNPCRIHPQSDRKSLACWSDAAAGVQCWIQQAQRNIEQQ